MEVLYDAKRARFLDALGVHADGARVVYAVGSKRDVALVGSARRPVISVHPLLAWLSYKVGLATHEASAHLRPFTIAGTARARLLPRRGYVTKPSDGSGGLGVARVESALGCDIHVPEGTVLQEEVACATHNGRKADVRIWLAIDCRGVAPPWVAPSCLVRVARSADQFATNTCVGGASGLPCADFEDAGTWWYGRAASCARAFAASVRAELRADPRAFWMLMGADVAVDVDGRAWLLEVNSLPAMVHADAPWASAMYTKWLHALTWHLLN